MANKLMYILNDVTQNYPCCVDCNQWLKRLDTQLNKPTNHNPFPKIVKPTNKKRYTKTLGTSVINSPLSTLSLVASPQMLLISGNNNTGNADNLECICSDQLCQLRGVYIYHHVCWSLTLPQVMYPPLYSGAGGCNFMVRGGCEPGRFQIKGEVGFG